MAAPVERVPSDDWGWHASPDESDDDSYYGSGYDSDEDEYYEFNSEDETEIDG